MLIKNRKFCFLWTALFISTIGDWAYYFVILLYMYKITKLNIFLGFLTITYTLPAIFFAPIAGILTDKFNKKKIMIFTDIVRAVIMSLFPLVKSLSIIYLLVFIEQSFTVLFLPASQAFVPQIIKGKKQLLKANSWIAGGKSVGRILGSAMGAFLYAAIGMEIIFLFDGLTYIVSLLCVIPIKYKAEDTFARPKSFTIPKLFNLKEFFEGYKIANKNVSIRYMLYNYAAVMFIASLVGTFLVTYCDVVLKRGGEIFGVLMSVQSSGAILFSLLIPILLRRFLNINLVRFSLISAIFFCLTPILLILFPNIPIVAVLLLLFGGIELSLGAIFLTIVQSEAANQYHGRIFSIQGAIFSFFYLAGAMGGGVLIDLFNINSIFITFGLILILFGFLFFYMFEKKRPRLANSEPPENKY